MQEAIAEEVLRAPGTGRGLPLPWWAKIAAKLVLSRLPVGYRGWARLGLFRHGRTDRDPARPVTAFESAFAAWAARRQGPPSAMLELGPGDSLGSALAAAARGVPRSVLVDTGDFATRDMRHYAAVAALLAARGTPAPPPGMDREAMLAAAGAQYLTGGVASLAALPAASVELSWSVAVLEHVRRAEMPRLFAELHRVTAPGGLGWHWVDLMDHLGGGLESLRFGARLWEAPWFAARSGFYTNRLRESELLALARAAGFRAAIAWRERWPAPPLPQARMAAPFRRMPEAELRVSAIRLLLMKPGHAGI